MLLRINVVDMEALEPSSPHSVITTVAPMLACSMQKPSAYPPGTHKCRDLHTSLHNSLANHCSSLKTLPLQEAPSNGSAMAATICTDQNSELPMQHPWQSLSQHSTPAKVL